MVTASTPFHALLVEDSEPDALLVGERLEMFAPGEFVIERAATLRDGLEKVANGHYAAALLDLQLPDGSGSHVWREFRSAAGSTPVVVLTAGTDPAIEEQAVEEGVQDFLFKAEVSGPGLVRALKHAIARETRISELRRQHLELMAAEARIRNLIVSSAEGIAVVDRSGVILFINAQGARWGGLPADRAVGARFPLEIPLKRIGYADVTVADSQDMGTGMRQVKVVRLELRTVPSTWSGKPVTVVTMRDVTERDSAATRLSLLTQLDRAIASSAGNVGEACETVADLLPRLVPYQRIEIAVSSAAGVPAAVVLQRGRVERFDRRSEPDFEPDGDYVTVPLGDLQFPRGWITVSSRRPGTFDDHSVEVLHHVATLVSASLGLLSARMESGS